jgi:4-alpha-glucanotransferase
MSAVDRLAERCGIRHSMVDVFGSERITTPEVKHALLKAMGFDVETDAQAEAAVAGLEAREWERPLPPVLVAYPGAVRVPVAVAQATHELSWTLRLEDGTERFGRASVSELAVLEDRTYEEQIFVRRELCLPENLPCGYHSLKLHGAEMQLIITPGKCWLPDVRDGRRYWGLAAALFLLRSERNWGIADFTDLRELVKLAESQGADLVGLSPLHAMFLDKPEDASPYSPSDRTLLNVLNIDVEAIPELRCSEQARKLMESEPFQQRLAFARGSPTVQYDTVAELKLAVLRLLFDTFEEQKDPQRCQQLTDFCRERGSSLERACLFQAMRAYFSSRVPSRADCQEWPEECRGFDLPGAAAFAEKQEQMVRFQLWLQWIADSQLREAAKPGEGMSIGIYRDLAVGAAPGGAEIWSQPGLLAAAASIGAPPDILNPSGQNWGLPPLNPITARHDAYRSFIELLRANMRYAGGLRIDHAMALQRLYWIPNGNEPKDGTYVHYPMDDLIGILALESQRHQCLVVGEDLGTVPEGFRERMAEANILSYRVLFFEKDETAFVPPEQYPYLALSVAGNHDLPTIRGWWQGSDIDLRERLGLFAEGAEDARRERENERQSLLASLEEQDLTPRGKQLGVDDLSQVVHAYLGLTNSLVAVVQLDDITNEEQQVNLPGTSNENPNWRRRLSCTLEKLASDPRLHAVACTLAERGKTVTKYSP